MNLCKYCGKPVEWPRGAGRRPMNPDGSVHKCDEYFGNKRIEGVREYLAKQRKIMAREIRPKRKPWSPERISGKDLDDEFRRIMG